MKKYNIVNNTLGWLMFLVAAVTYLLTLEPTASFWDCPEFIAQGFKSEVGHPPGNPIFILASRFAANFAGGDITKVAVCVNAMSAIFSALTILLLFWTITHLVKKLVVEKGQEDNMTLANYLVIMGSGVCGALAYTWSDTFWFSAVEAEVYAFSSFCTALVFWLILKWEARADQPGSDRWLILIAYIIGVSLGVHLLNLLCIPAIALVFYYRKFENTNVKGSLLTLLISFGLIVAVLYGLEPGFVKVAQQFDLLFVNGLGMSFNSGALFYALLLMGVLGWSIYELYKRRSKGLIKISFFLGLFLSGVLFIGSSLLVWCVLVVGAFIAVLLIKKVPVRIYSNISISILVIFIGFASYGLILIRSSANLPLDENSPSNTFELAKYLSREQYGESPLFYGRTFLSGVVYDENGAPIKEKGDKIYTSEVKENPDSPDHYYDNGYRETTVSCPEQNMFFPRIHSENHASQYAEWLDFKGELVDGTVVQGRPKQKVLKPTFGENLRWFFDYQVNYMYWRYFMWNFAGRQNDIQGMGEVTQGNWISGIPFIDNARLGDQSLLPDELGEGNKGHNVFYMLPLLLGIIGLLWQAFRGKKGIEQFWVIFFLFFMTGLAIVVYLNQTPSQPRERDYAYAGSFYAFAIWLGMGVAGIYYMIKGIASRVKKSTATSQNPANASRFGLVPACVASLIGLAVPLQMVSQTWDDHDRSGRYCARDFGMNYLSSLDENAIIFTNGDNDTFPLWYLQEVEDYRTDVRVVNLSYLSTDWYIRQMQRAAYKSKPLPMLADKYSFAYDKRQYGLIDKHDVDYEPVPVLKSLEHYYSKSSFFKYGNSIVPKIKYPVMYIPINKAAAVKAGVVPVAKSDMVEEAIPLNFDVLSASQVMSLDLIASSINQGWKRPCYFAMTVPDYLYLGLTPYLQNTGMAYQVTPVRSADGKPMSNTDKMYKNVMTKFRWGGLDTAEPGSIYLDETVRRMVTTTRFAIIRLASDLADEGAAALNAIENGNTTFLGKDAKAYAADRFKKAYNVLEFMNKKLPVKACAYSLYMGQQLASVYEFIGRVGKNKNATKRAVQILNDEIMRYAKFVCFYQSLDPATYKRINSDDTTIDQVIFYELLTTYNKVNPQGMEAMLTKVEKAGVNLQRVKSLYEQRRAREEEARRQAEQEAMSADFAGEE